jgi:hypothetical protein
MIVELNGSLTIGGKNVTGLHSVCKGMLHKGQFSCDFTSLDGMVDGVPCSLSGSEVVCAAQVGRPGEGLTAMRATWIWTAFPISRIIVLKLQMPTRPT